MNGEILAVVTPSPVRRWMGVLMQSLIGMISIYVAFASPPEQMIVWRRPCVAGPASWSAKGTARWRKIARKASDCATLARPRNPRIPSP